jgi:hypothetical protein
LCKKPAAAAGNPLVPAKDRPAAGYLAQRAPGICSTGLRYSPPRGISWEESLSHRGLGKDSIVANKLAEQLRCRLESADSVLAKAREEKHQAWHPAAWLPALEAVVASAQECLKLLQACGEGTAPLLAAAKQETSNHIKDLVLHYSRMLRLLGEAQGGKHGSPPPCSIPRQALLQGPLRPTLVCSRAFARSCCLSPIEGLGCNSGSHRLHVCGPRARHRLLPIPLRTHQRRTVDFPPAPWLNVISGLPCHGSRGSPLPNTIA